MTATDAVKTAAEQFARDTANHAMTVLHDDGLYRHLRFAQPGTSFYWFDLITWPGNLAVKGDMGGYMFARTEDMFEFFRARSGWNSGTVNPGYWAEKMPDSGKSVREYSAATFVAQLKGCLVEYAMGRRGGGARAGSLSPAAAWALLVDAQTDGETDFEEGARSLLAELERGGVVSDTWEWDLSDWTYQYLWACHAIQWGIDRYDAARTSVEAGAR